MQLYLLKGSQGHQDNKVFELIHPKQEGAHSPQAGLGNLGLESKSPLVELFDVNISKCLDLVSVIAMPHLTSLFFIQIETVNS